MKNKLFNITIIIILLMSFISCSPQKTKWSEINGVTIIENPKRPINISDILHLENEFSIDTEKDEIAKLGLTDIEGFDVDSEEYIYVYLPSKVYDELIYKFDRAGRFITSFAPRGPGPGEIQNASFLRITEKDEIPVIDTGGLKLIVFKKDGKVLGEIRLDFKIAAHGYVYPLENGTYLARYIEGRLTKTGENQPVQGVTWSLSLFDSNFNWIKTIDQLHLNRQLLNMRSPFMMPVYFWELSNGKIFVANSQWGYEIRIFDINGNLVRKIRKDYKPVEFSKKILKIYERRNIAIPEFHPSFQRLFFTDNRNGNFFIMTFEKGENPREYLFDIFNKDGIFIGKISLDIYVERYTNRFPLYAVIKNQRLFYIREKESGYKELICTRLIWK